jgi:hypothetical protein
VVPAEYQRVLVTQFGQCLGEMPSDDRASIFPESQCLGLQGQFRISARTMQNAPSDPRAMTSSR